MSILGKCLEEEASSAFTRKIKGSAAVLYADFFVIFYVVENCR